MQIEKKRSEISMTMGKMDYVNMLFANAMMLKTECDKIFLRRADDARPVEGNPMWLETLASNITSFMCHVIYSDDNQYLPEDYLNVSYSKTDWLLLSDALASYQMYIVKATKLMMQQTGMIETEHSKASGIMTRSMIREWIDLINGTFRNLSFS